MKSRKPREEKAKKCEKCGNFFKFRPRSQKEFKIRKYCGWKCAQDARKGYISTAKTRKKISESVRKAYASDSKNPGNRKNGEFISIYGYLQVCSPKHPNRNSNGYVQKHRLVMEEHLGRYLKESEEVHHIDGDKLNNKIENLKLFKNRSEHIKYHWLLKKQLCP